MPRNIVVFYLLLFILGTTTLSTGVYARQHSDLLVTINSQEYSTDDFLNWWEYWKDETSKFPDDLTDFINWNLLGDEANSMELFSAQSYLKKVNVFLRARSLMMLKYDEIDSKITREEGGLRKWYDENYVPRHRVLILYFQQLNQANIFVKDKGGRLFSEEAAREVVKGALSYKPFVYGPKWMTPKDVPEGWDAMLKEAEINNFSTPVPIGKGFAVFLLLEKQEGSKDDFRKVKDTLQQRIEKDKEKELTNILVRKLKNKFAIRVDNVLVEKINPFDPQDEDLEKTLIFSKKADVSVRFFLSQFQKGQRIRGPNKLVRAEDINLDKKMFVNTLVANSVTSWEAMERHYETKPLFKPLFEFYKKNQLVKAAENRLLKLDKKIRESEITEYYEKNKSRYKISESVTIVILYESPKILKKIWLDVLQGGKLQQVAAKYTQEKTYVKKININHLKPNIIKKIKELQVGGVTTPFEEDGKYTLISLLGRQEEGYLPIGEVRAEIFKRLKRDKYKVAKQHLLDTLNSRSNIEVNEKVWHNLQQKFD